MNTLHEIARTIDERLPEVIGRFAAVIRQDPWIHLPADYRVNYMGDVVALAAELALRAPEDEALCRRLLHLAARHGEVRLEQALPDTILFQELYLAREAVWRFIHETHGDSGLAAEAIVRIDLALSLAGKASLRGYHRPAYEARGDWPATIDALADEWTPPPPVDELPELLNHL